MNVEYIIVQAGGKGTRLRPLTNNKPKSLVPVHNLPILFHLFKKYSKQRFIVIGDYKFDVLSRYLEAYADVSYLLVHAQGSGNVAGIDTALNYIPENTPFMVIWSDLLLSDDFDISLLKDGCYVGVTDQFPCSWSFQGGRLQKADSWQTGVAGCFLFDKKQRLSDIPHQGSFTEYLRQSEIPLKEMGMGCVTEIGTLEAFNRVDIKENRCRPYNRITITGDRVVKEGLTLDAKKLIQRECDWYKELSALGFQGIPQIYSLEPLTMARIHGDNIFKIDMDDDAKKVVLEHLIQRLDEIHKLKKGKVNYLDMQEDYYFKTMKRLRSIRDIIPFSNEKEILINGRMCRNILIDPMYLQKKVTKILQTSEFGIIHGDCTLTNTLVDTQYNIYFIDARGYFGHTPLIGDVYYDWAKVYYSIQGAFDQFNVNNFTLEIRDKDVIYSIAPSGWEHLVPYFIKHISNCDMYRVKLIHAIIWLSLASHCWEDYDSLCTAFYNGLYLLNTLDD